MEQGDPIEYGWGMPGRHDHREHRGLLLDFGGVLTTSLLDAIRRFCVECGLAANTLLDLFRDDPVGRRLLADVECGVISQPEFERGVGKLLGVDPERLVQRLLGGVEPEPTILAAAGRARAAGIRTGVLSNSWGLDPFDPYAGWRLAERFDAVVISEHTGTRKPDPAIYTLAAERLGLPCDVCVFVDDLRRNLEPARALGMTVIHKTSADQVVTDLERVLGLPLR
jgi:putative hydrolase of the HAD superfamily